MVTGSFRADLHWQQCHMTLHHLCFYTRLPAPSAFPLHLLLPWFQWFQRGCITVSLSLSLSSFAIANIFTALWCLILNRAFFYTSAIRPAYYNLESPHIKMHKHTYKYMCFYTVCSVLSTLGLHSVVALKK